MNDHPAPSPYDEFRLQVYELVCEIPRGKVMTYGGVASHIPQPAGIDPLAYKKIRARWVGYAMKSCPDDVPWWRVINSKGQISVREGHGPQIQPLMLEGEGIVMDEKDRIPLKKFLWHP